MALVKNLDIDDLDDGKESLKGYRSLRDGPEPVVHRLETAEAEREAIVNQLLEWLDRYDPWEICIAARKNDLIRDRYLPMLQEAGLEPVVVKKQSDDSLGSGIRLATMHRLKGLEFSCVWLAGINDGWVPRHYRGPADDAAAKADHEQGERCLMYVAATRARDELVISGFGKVSEFLAE